MADVTAFPILKKANGAAAVQEAAAEGDVLKSVQMAVLVAKDASGNEAKIPLTADGRVPVSQDAAGTVIKGFGRHTLTALDAFEDVVTLSLTAGEDYICSEFIVSHPFPCEWKIIHNDDGTPVELASVDTGSGNLAMDVQPKSLNFTAGASGTQELKVQCLQKNGPLSDAKAHLSSIQTA